MIDNYIQLEFNKQYCSAYLNLSISEKYNLSTF